uniref:Peptidase A1 domain-containing protein n=2 Tax=Aegilops tauschii TaxID=37682 RepID=A0A453T0X7_AEGTS
PPIYSFSMAPKSILALALLVVLVPSSHGVTDLVSSSPRPFNGSGGGGFSLRLIANDHPAHYDLASLQRAKDQVKCRIKHQILPTVNEIRPFMCRLDDMMYAVMVGVGTGAGFQNYQLALDMAGGLSWMQCLPCQPCLAQLNPVFDPTKSPTYSTVPAHNTLWCRPPYQALPNGACGFRIEYRDTTGASGYLARDTFSFPTGNNQFVPLEGVVFGCAHRTEHFHNQDKVAGILSLGMGPVGKPPTAFTKQVLRYHGGRFSYCPFKPGTSLYSYLRFGNDIPSRPPAGVHRQSTPVLAPAENREAYFVKLAGITIGVNRLCSVTPDMFRARGVRPHRAGGAAAPGAPRSTYRGGPRPQVRAAPSGARPPEHDAPFREWRVAPGVAGACVHAARRRRPPLPVPWLRLVHGPDGHRRPAASQPSLHLRPP